MDGKCQSILTTHGAARIDHIDAASIDQRLSQGRVLLAFRALARTVSPPDEGLILAVAMAAALNADRCDIYTDVDGVYATDPRIAPKARKLDRITFEEMLEMASSGAKRKHAQWRWRYDVNLQEF